MGVAVDAGLHPKTADFLERMHNRPSYAPLIAKERAFFNKAS